VAALIEDKLSGKSEPPKGPRILERAPATSQAPRAASPELEPIPSAGPTGGFSAPPPAQKADAPRSEESKENGEERRPRRRRSRRGGEGRGGERERREGAGGAPRRMAETIDNSDGKEFWEAWVDSKSEAPAGGESAAPSEPREEREPRQEREPREPREGRPRRERDETPLPEGHVRLYLNLGRRDGAKEPEIEALLQEKGVEVASLQLRNSHTYLIVPEERADSVRAALTGGKFGERDVVCERARK